MTSPFGPMTIVTNPRAGRGRNAALPRLTAALDELGLEHEVELTRRPGEAVALAREAVTERGRRFIVALGGDGTVHEVVNGLVDAERGEPVADDLVLGVVAGGSGCDFIRTFGLDRAPERAARHLAGSELFPIDLGRVRLTGPDGRERVRLFANIAEAGYGGLVTDRANRLPRFLGKSRYLLAIFAAIRSFELVEASVTVDHTSVAEEISNLVVANGQFFGGNLKVAPRALPDDGIFNVQIWQGEVKDVFVKTPRIRHGEHLGDADVREYQSSRVEIEASDPLLIEADGEVLGSTPASFDLLPRVLSLKV